MISANGGLPAHRYTPQVTPRWPRGSEPASSPLPWGVGDAYDVCGASMCPWDMGGGERVGAHWGPPVLSSMTSERIQRSEKGGEAGSDPRGHLGVTWGVYLCAG